jgi:hypothetical protein
MVLYQYTRLGSESCINKLDGQEAASDYWMAQTSDVSAKYEEDV